MKNQLLFFCMLLLCNTLTKAQDYPEMISVEGGTFMMGDIEMEGSENEQPAHEVTLKSFKIAKTETTVAQWKAFCTATGTPMPNAPSWGWIDTHPIVNVNYIAAVEYCNWLGEEYGGDWRLPTEAEWEFAARGGNLTKGTKYSGGRSIDLLGVYEANSNNQTAAVGSKKPNELGIYDMSGNVLEWCKDWYGEYHSSAHNNPQGPAIGSYRVLRGGSWGNAARYCRVADRNSDHPLVRYSFNGFRVLLSQ